MFHSKRARLAMRRAMRTVEEERRDSPRFEVPLEIHDPRQGYREHYGRLGINGFYFETTEIPMIGQRIRVKVALVGLGIEVETVGTVTSVVPARGHVGVVARFEDIEFDTERFIARWLDLMNMACNQAAG